MKNTIKQHQSDYKAEAWREYTLAELGNWVHLLARRSEHRESSEKRKKDLRDARNYLAMMDKVLEEMELLA